MEKMNDQELDALIMESLERQEIVEQLNVAVMKDLQRKARRELWHKWGRLVVIAFAVPLLVAFFVFSVVQGWYAGHGTVCEVACLAIQVICTFLGFCAFLEKFNPSTL